MALKFLLWTRFRNYPHLLSKLYFGLWLGYSLLDLDISDRAFLFTAWRRTTGIIPAAAGSLISAGRCVSRAALSIIRSIETGTLEYYPGLRTDKSADRSAALRAGFQRFIIHTFMKKIKALP